MDPCAYLGASGSPWINTATCPTSCYPSPSKFLFQVSQLCNTDSFCTWLTQCSLSISSAVSVANDTLLHLRGPFPLGRKMFVFLFRSLGQKRTYSRIPSSIRISAYNGLYATKLLVLDLQRIRASKTQRLCINQIWCVLDPFPFGLEMTVSRIRVCTDI